MLFILRHDDQTITIPDTDIIDYFANTKLIASSLVVDPQSHNLTNQVLFTDDKSLIEPLIVKQFAK
jgi:hypothetical protein